MAINPLQPPINYAAQTGSLAPAFEGFGQAIDQRRVRMQEQAKQQEMEAAKAQYAADLQAAIENPTQSAWNEMIAKYPQQYKAFESARKSYGEERVKSEFNEGAEISMVLENGREDLALPLITRAIEARKNSGQPAGVYQRVADALEAGDTNAAQATVNAYLAFADPDRFKKMVDAKTAVTAEQRTAELFPALQAQKQAEMLRAQSEAEKSAIEAKYAERLQKAQLNKATRDVEAQGGDRVQSSSIKPDGTTIIVTSSGQTRVIGADGVELTGQARVDAVRDAEEFGADIQALRAGARKAGEIGQAEALRAFEQVGKVRSNVSNLESAIAALDAGASSGVIESRFPNWKASTIELQNIQRQLGLDIIGSVTFGALSEGELSLALETALPLNMGEDDLRDWLSRKRDAQMKLADYLSQQARYLSVPGRTIGDWMQIAEQGGAQPGGMAPPGGAPAPAPAPAGGVRVTSPSGQVFVFPSQQSADEFKRAAGIQ